MLTRMSQFDRRNAKKNTFSLNYFENSDGLTLIELVVVISLIAIISSVVIFRMDSLIGWKTESELRRFANTIQLVRNDSVQRQERYRIKINLDEQYYYVRREVPLDPGEIKQVDLLENLKTKGEKKRKEQATEDELISLEEEFSELDIKQGGALEELYYQSVFSDPQVNVRLGIPTSFPSLAKPKTLDSSLRIRDVVLGEQVIESGSVELRFLSRAPSPTALIHFEGSDESIVYTLALHPESSSVQILGGDLDSDEAFKAFKYEKKK